MARINFALPLSELRGKLRSITFRMHFSKPVVEKTPEIFDKKSLAQLSWRTMYQKATALWHALSPDEKKEWESLGTEHQMTGYPYFLSQALKPNPGIYLPLAGGIMQGAINMDSSPITALPDPVNEQDPVTLAYFLANAPPSGKVLSFSHDRTLPAGNYSFTGFGFKPKSAFIFCDNDVMSHGSVAIINGDLQSICFFRTSGGAFSVWNKISACLICQSSGSNYEHAKILSFDDDGLTLEFTKLGNPTGELLIIISAAS